LPNQGDNQRVWASSYDGTALEHHLVQRKRADAETIALALGLERASFVGSEINDQITTFVDQNPRLRMPDKESVSRLHDKAWFAAKRGGLGPAVTIAFGAKRRQWFCGVMRLPNNELVKKLGPSEAFEGIFRSKGWPPRSSIATNDPEETHRDKFPTTLDERLRRNKTGAGRSVLG
jgi:hypothetical protein